MWLIVFRKCFQTRRFTEAGAVEVTQQTLYTESKS